MESTNNSDVDFKLEVVVIPVSDVDRAKSFYGGLGWRLDADYASDDGYFRVIQFTPPGSGSSVIFGKNVTAAAPGSAQGLYLIVSDIGAARDELIGRGVGISEVFHDDAGVYAGTDEPYQPVAEVSLDQAVSAVMTITRTADPSRDAATRMIVTASSV
jgi:catechol 2,3-dioxygenase-like lactoylglutathione lyase family enzyme